MKIRSINVTWERRLSLPGHERQTIGAFAMADLEGDERLLENAKLKFEELGELCQQSVEKRGVEFMSKTEGLQVVDRFGNLISTKPFLVIQDESGDTKEKSPPK